MTTSDAAATAATTAPSHDAMLRLGLRLDAVVTGLNGAAYLAGAALLDGVLGISTGVLRGAGGFLLAFAVAVWLVGTRPTVSVSATRVVVELNLLWAAGSPAAAVFGWGTPTTAGTVWIGLQAAVVAGFGALQWIGLRRSSSA